MGRVPPVQFVKDKSVARLEEVERLLKDADMGPDHVPSEIGHDMKTNPTLSKIPPRISLRQGMEDTVSNFQRLDILGSENIVHHGATRDEHLRRGGKSYGNKGMKSNVELG